MKDLTREEAERRAALLHVASYDVELDLRQGPDTFASTVVVRFSCREQGAESFLELDGELLSGTLDGRPLQQVGNRLPLTGLGGEHEVRVEARCAYSRTGEGLHRFVDPADGAVYVWGQSFLDDAQRQFACFDQPDLKATFAVSVLAPAGWTVVLNGRATQDGDRWSAPPTPRMSTYLVHVSAGPWHGVHRQTGSGSGTVELGLWCRQSLAPHLDAAAEEVFDVTQRCLAHQERLFGRAYPFGDTYDQLFVPEFNHGAMENAGAVTFTEDFLPRSRTTQGVRRKRAMVVAHEMAHMWFGDLVTMRWWDDLWLNESFAELLGFLTVDRATRHEDTWVDFAASRKAWGYRADQLPSTHPVQGDVADNRSALLNFDGISYAKGASVLRQLMATVTEEAFFGGVRAYLERYAFGSTSFADLLAELERASGRDLQEWSRAWLQTSGVSTLRVVDGAVESDGLRPHRIGVGLYDRAGERLVLRERVDVSLDGLRAPVDTDADLVLPNDGDLTFAKLRFTPRSLDTVLVDLHRLDDPLARALCWAALWDACRDAELPAATFVEAVLANVHGESDPSVVATLLAQATTAATLFTADGPRTALAQACWDAGAPPGSDLQLVRVRAFADVAGPGEADRLAALLDGSGVPEGLAVDTDLRWTLVQAAARLGRLSEADVDAELARDTTAAGIRSALTARAALPDAAGKERSWRAATEDGSLSNHEAHALAAGFWQVGQDELLEPYVDRYVEVLPELWRTRSPEVVSRLTELLFPSTLVRQDVLDRTAPLLAEPHPAGLRRLVAERRDDLRRALAARALR